MYTNTHLEPPDSFYRDPKWAGLADWKTRLPSLPRGQTDAQVHPAAQFYETDEALRGVLSDMGTGQTFKKHTVGVFFGPSGQKVPDRHFGGRGPDRTGCTTCGACMVGCRVGAKTRSTKLPVFAEQRGAKVFAETRVLAVRPIGSSDGSEGYEVETECSTRLPWQSTTQVHRAERDLFGGRARDGKAPVPLSRVGVLPNISTQLGRYVRTNSESISGAVAWGRDLSRGVAISSGGHTPDGTHVEIYRYGQHADAMGLLGTVHTKGGKLPRQLYFWRRFFASSARLALRSSLWPFGWSKRNGGVLAMQSVDNSMELHYKRSLLSPFSKSLASDWGDRPKPPTYLPEANGDGAAGEANGGAADVGAAGSAAGHDDDGAYPRRLFDGGRVLPTA